MAYQFFKLPDCRGLARFHGQSSQLFIRPSICEVCRINYRISFCIRKWRRQVLAKPFAAQNLDTNKKKGKKEAFLHATKVNIFFIQPSSGELKAINPFITVIKMMFND